MKKILNYIFTTKYFVQFKDKKFVVLDLLYYCFLVAIAIGEYGLIHAVKYGFQYTLFEFIYFIPFVFLAGYFIFVFYIPGVKWNKVPEAWSQLYYLSKIPESMRNKEMDFEYDFLASDFEYTYKVAWDNRKFKWYNSLQPIIILIEVLIIYLIFK